MHNARRLACLVWFAILIGGSPAVAQEPPEKTADALIKAGKHADALAVLARLRPAGDEAARVDLLRSTALRALGRLDESKAAADRARRAAAATRAHAVETRALLQLAQLASDRGDNDEAATLLAPALASARLSKDSLLPISVLEALGRNARTRGDNTGALEHQGAAIAAAESANALEIIVRARGARSATLLGLGRFDDALADAQAAYERAARAPARLKASATFALAQVHAHLWNLDRAVVLWGEAIEHYTAAGLQIGIALSTRQRMDTWLALGEFDRAAADGAEALRMFERTGSAGTTPDVFARLALIEARRGKQAQARAYAARAAALPQDGPRRRFTENDLGLTALFLGDHAQAADRFTSVLQQSIALGDQEYMWRAQHMRGRVEMLRGNLDAAESDLRSAAATLERMRRTLPEAGMRAAFLADRRDVYAALADTLLRKGHDTVQDAILESLAVADQSRARSLIEQITEAERRRSDPALEEIRRQEQAFSARLTALQQRAAASSPASQQTVRAELAAAEAEYDALLIKLRRESAAYREAVNPQALDGQTIRALPQHGEVIVSYLFTSDAGIAWAIGGGRVTAFRIPDRKRFDGQVRLMTAMIESGDVEGMRALGTSLYASLLAPAAGILSGARRLTILPDGPLHRLPFALLRQRGDGGWLAEAMPISFAPSASVLAALRARDRAGAPGALAAFAAEGPGTTRTASLIDAAPRAALEHAAREVTDVARIVSNAGPVRVVRSAAERGVKDSGLDRFRVLHFAAHAVVDETAPRRSAIVLAPSDRDDGLLQLNEIAALNLNARLVVAAACRSQIGRAVGGEGFMSLSRAFLQGGADAVVAALWDVDDAETRRFMRYFYDALRAGRSADDALRAAQRSMLNAGGRSAAARNWAGFVLTGSGSAPVFTPPAKPAAPAVRWPIVAAVIGAALLLLSRKQAIAEERALIGS